MHGEAAERARLYPGFKAVRETEVEQVGRAGVDPVRPKAERLAHITCGLDQRIGEWVRLSVARLIDHPEIVVITGGAVEQPPGLQTATPACDTHVGTPQP